PDPGHRARLVAQAPGGLGHGRGAVDAPPVPVDGGGDDALLHWRGGNGGPGLHRHLRCRWVPLAVGATGNTPVREQHARTPLGHDRPPIEDTAGQSRGTGTPPDPGETPRDRRQRVLGGWLLLTAASPPGPRPRPDQASLPWMPQSCARLHRVGKPPPSQERLPCSLGTTSRQACPDHGAGSPPSGWRPSATACSPSPSPSSPCNSIHRTSPGPPP